MNAAIDIQRAPADTSERVECRICNEFKGRLFQANGYRWFDCGKCGTTQKVLSLQQYRNLNPSYDPGIFLDSKDRQHIERYLSVDESERTLRDTVDNFLRPASGAGRHFLDIGCGMGQYLLAAQRLGFEVLGFEPSTTHARVAKEHFGLPIISEYFSPEKVLGRSFDLIMLSHVIEHIYDPQQFIRDIIQSLKVGGALIVITPNNESLVARSLGSAWPMLKPVDHVSMISARAYSHFDLGPGFRVNHSTSEYPFEFMGSMFAALKSKLKANPDESSNQNPSSAAQPPPLRGVGMKTRLLRFGLSVASAPMYIAAASTGRQGCLKTVIVRSA